MRAFALVAMACAALACGAEERLPEMPELPALPEGLPRSIDRDEVARQVRELYDRARSAGERVPEDAYEWAKGDVERIGDWEYRVLSLDAASDEALAEQLNAFGAERWEVFWIDRGAVAGEGLRLFLKRPARSYLRHLPLSELTRLLPSGSSGE